MLFCFLKGMSQIFIFCYKNVLQFDSQEALEKEGGGNSTETDGDGEKKDDAWAKLGDTISNFFGGQSAFKYVN
jgi:hypothetical protein